MPATQHFSKILVANRGEIAARVMRTIHAQGYRSVAVYTDADRHAEHTALADEAVRIGEAAVGASYLAMEKIIDAARAVGADAIHPGYGFLSENADFARACRECGIAFIGPPEDAIRLMGNKRQAKIAMLEAGVPCVPGYEGDSQDDETLADKAMEIGFPVMVKAAAGGGGRGMRLVHGEDELLSSLRSARSEAEHGFGSGELILEKAVIEPRHVEIQVFADRHGNCIYLGERDCSIQRRHQKVVEEAPSPAVNPELRRRMGEAAVQAARACDYVGAGTVEFLLAPDGEFYFLEMNTRLQVEHPVTELITGTDLVAWQIAVAEGAPLPLAQDDVKLDGHAIEVRLYAEAPGNGFLPQTGKILAWEPALDDGVRVDSGIRVGQPVTPHYDPILAKLVAWGPDRETARRRLVRALDQSLVLGVNTNRAFLSAVLGNAVFREGAATTAFIEQEFSDHPTLSPYVPTLVELGVAALLQATDGDPQVPVLAVPVPARLVLECAGQEYPVSVQALAGGGWRVQRGDEDIRLYVESVAAGRCVVRSEDLRREYRFAVDGDLVHLDTANAGTVFHNVTWAEPETDGRVGTGNIAAPMDGSVVEVRVAVGDRVARGDILAILEAMKMEHPLRADVDGTVSELLAGAGDQVRGRQVLVRVEAEA